MANRVADMYDSTFAVSISRYVIRDFQFVYYRATPLTHLEINESPDGICVRLQLSGELDLGSAPTLRRRLEELRAEKHGVRLDLSGLEFIDSSGIHLLIDAFGLADADGWDLEVDPKVSSQVERVFELTNLWDLIGRHSGIRC